MKSEKDLHHNDFFERVYQVVRLIPESRVTTYGLIAAYLGSPQAGRMVGWAMNNAHNVQPPVPAHRVVNRNGVLTGKHHFGGEHVMEDLLRSEGITVVNDNIVDFKKHLWNPREAL
ncbi:MAG: MGMT family protein [Candidatus Delongbacteria bacterium]|jgi:methylated-DNA-protein-cysteine methyltransferase-like protein|nr:MGMT family protein [Candidatus Delongbacteria bacterium]